ncbi:hypothetical protein HKCCE3408_08455 [Rhodobacterales bacterium HKCCE3408]|nr:hypothetical protein [Rhodobacterales bacterium HKCCE3408]
MRYFRVPRSLVAVAWGLFLFLCLVGGIWFLIQVLRDERDARNDHRR